MFCSQGGNILFPRWEYLLPLMGKMMVLILWQEASDNKKAQSIFKKVPIPPVNLSECLYIKGFRYFHPSLDPSRHLSHISPVNPHIIPHYLPRKERRIRFGRAISALGFEHKEHSHVAYYKVVPLRAAWSRRERWRERYGRDWKHPSRAQTPLYKGIFGDLGRDEGLFRESFK